MSRYSVDMRFRRETDSRICRYLATRRGFCFERATMEGAFSCDYGWSGDRHYLALHDLVIAEGEIGISARPEARRADLRGRMTFAPAGSTIEGWSTLMPRPHSYLAMFFDPGLVEEELRCPSPGGYDFGRVYFADRELGATLGKIDRLLGAGEEPDPMLLETLGLVAILELGRASAQPRPKGQLSPRQLTQVLEFIDAYFQTPLTLDQLAKVAGLSRYHFSRAFTQSMGKSPLAYVRARRIEETKRLLEKTSISLEEIAPRVGFGSARSLSQAFVRFVGVPPNSYRRGII